MLNYIARILPEVRERFALPCELDAVRIRVWQGERIDFTHRTGCYPQLMWVGAAAVALQDAEVCRKTLRALECPIGFPYSTRTSHCKCAWKSC